MLILTRHLGEKIVIGDGVNVPYMDITVLETNGKQVRIGLNAPRDVPIHRQEIHEKIQQGLEQASHNHDVKDEE